MNTVSTLQDKFKTEIAKELETSLGIKNVNAVPALSKIVVNMGVKDALADKKNIEKACGNSGANHRTKTKSDESQKINLRLLN